MDISFSSNLLDNYFLMLSIAVIWFLCKGHMKSYLDTEPMIAERTISITISRNPSQSISLELIFPFN